MSEFTCSAKFRTVITTKDGGIATQFGHPACGMSATRSRRVEVTNHYASYHRTLHFCEEHARDTDTVIAPEPEPDAKLDTACPSLTPYADKPNYHFLGRGCYDCDAFHMKGRTPDSIAEMKARGSVGQALYEAFMHVWATSAFRGNPGSWAEVPTDPEVIAYAETLRRIHNVPSLIAA